MNMLIVILMICCLPVRPSEHTGSCVKPRTMTENDADADQPEQQTIKQHLMFKKPEYVWGKEFNNSNAKTLCEACVFVRGGDVETIRFTKRGVNQCSKVCGRQKQRVLRVAPTKVTLADGYCTKKRLMAATCVCVFKITCQENNHYAFMHFIASRTGHVALLYFEAGHPITVSMDTL